MIIFACISPHPPIILPSVGTKEDRVLANGTIKSLKSLGKELMETNPQIITISSPRQDWGFDVPLHFLAKGSFAKIETFLTGANSASEHFNAGKTFFKDRMAGEKINVALIASGNLSHRLKINDPCGPHPDGAKFDKELIDGLKRKDVKMILDLDCKYPEAGEYGLRSFCFVIGILGAAKINWNIEILSYETPFGVGYLVAKFKI